MIWTRFVNVNTHWTKHWTAGSSTKLQSVFPEMSANFVLYIAS